VLDDDAGRGALGVKLANALIGSVGVVDVVVGEFAALQLPRGGDARAFVGRPIERRSLMRILAIAQRLDQPPAEGAEIRCVVLELKRKPVRDRSVVSGGAGIGFCGQAAA